MFTLCGIIIFVKCFIYLIRLKVLKFVQRSEHCNRNIIIFKPVYRIVADKLCIDIVVAECEYEGCLMMCVNSTNFCMRIAYL